MTRKPLLLLGLLAGFAARGCACSETDAPVLEPLPLDEPVPPGQARAGVVRSPAELIGGISAKGAVGDIKVYNEHIAVLIGQPGLARGYNPYGGSILDADIVRPVGTPGESAFGEVIVTVDLFILDGASTEVLNDGRDGEAARVRVVGKVAEMPILSALFSELFGAEPYELEWRVDYILEPGAHQLRCEYEVFNPGRRPVDVGLTAGAFIFDSAQAFVEGYGFKPPATEGTGAYYGASADHVSYLYGGADTRLNIVASGSGIVFSALGEGFTIRARERIAYTHFLVVAEDIAQAQVRWREAIGEEAGVELKGRVVDAAGVAGGGARVHVLDQAGAGNRDYLTRTVADADGQFAVTVPKGAYRLIAVTDALTQSAALTIDASADMVTTDLVVATAGVIEYLIKDDEDRKLPVKLSIRPVGANPPSIPSSYGEVGLRYGLTRTVFAHRGEGQVGLPPGTYDVFVSRGSEYEMEVVRSEVEAGVVTPLQAMLARSVSTPGWVSTDTHVHSQLSADSPDSFEDKVRAMVVEGLEVPVSTEHEAIGDFDPAIAELGLGTWINGIVGSEVTTAVYGHFNAFPLVADPSKPGNGRIDWYGLDPVETFANVRANSGQPFLQVNHPRAASIGGYLSAMGYNRETGVARRADWSPDFDGLEVMNGCNAAGIEAAEVKDWFSFLNDGARIMAIGSTDNHSAESGNMGLPRTYLRVGTDDPSAVTDDAFREAFVKGRLVVSCGPFLTAKVGAAEVGDTATLAGDLVSVDVHIEAPSWMDVDQVQLIVNGQLMKTQPLITTQDVLRFEGTLTASVSPGQDAWVVVATSGDQPHGIWARNRASFAFTNAIYIDGDGDGEWTMSR